jgi:drug/metabolite transporter (DMT)-like permease
VAALLISLAGGLLPGSRGPGGELRELVRPLHTPALVRMLALPTLVATILSLPLHTAASRGAPPQVSALVLSTSPLFILPLGRFFGARHGLLSVIGTRVGLVGVAGVLRLTAGG